MPGENDRAGLPTSLNPDDAAGRVAKAHAAIEREIQKTIVGNEDLVELLLIALLARGHVLISGRPGTGKTELLSVFARVLGLKFRHYLLVADTLPDDLTGYEREVNANNSNAPSTRRIVRGPLFADLFVADGVDQAPRRTQVELFHGLRHGRVVIAGRTYELEDPRLVCALRVDSSNSASNPLSEQQLDQFMFSWDMGYPSQQAECEAICRSTAASTEVARVVLRPRDILWTQQLLRNMPVASDILNYAVDIVRATRPDEEGVPGFVRDWVAFGASPRASEQLVLAAKARALVKGRSLVHSADVRAVARQVLRHRVVTGRDAQQRGVTAEQVVDRIVAVVKERSMNPPAAPVNLVVVSDPAPTAISIAPTDAATVSNTNQPVRLPNRPYPTLQPPLTAAWPTPPATKEPPQASQWPPDAVPRRQQEADEQGG